MQGPGLVKTWTLKLTCNSMLDYAREQLADIDVPAQPVLKGNTMSALAQMWGDRSLATESYQHRKFSSSLKTRQ